MEEMSAVLNVCDTRLPEQTQDVLGLNADVTQTIELRAIPEDTIDTGAMLQFVIGLDVIGILKLILLQDHRNDRGEHLCLCLISFLSGQDIGAGEVVHGISVFIGNGIKQPAGHRLYLIALLLSHALPVAELVPLLRLNHLLLKVGFAFLVLLECLSCLLHLLLADDLCQGSEAIQRTVVRLFAIGNTRATLHLNQLLCLILCRWARC